MMSGNNEANAFILKVGLALGLAFSASIFIAHLKGLNHIPGDSISWLNIIIFMLVVMVSGRQYRQVVYGDGFTYGKAYGYVTKLNLISALVLSIFTYFYYSSIAPFDLEYLFDQIKTQNEQTSMFSAEYMESFKSMLSAEAMAFVIFFYQFVGMSIFGLVLANIIRSKTYITTE